MEKEFKTIKIVYTIKDIWEEKIFYEASFVTLTDLLNYIYEYMRTDEDAILYDNNYEPFCKFDECLEKTGQTWAEWMIATCKYRTIVKNLLETHYEIIETPIIVEKVDN